MTDPYRSASTESCPACANALLAPDDDGTRLCPAGCGEWVGKAVMERLWGRVTLRDPRSLSLGGDVCRCVVCREAMNRYVSDAYVLYVCVDHGVWFERDTRAGFEKRNAKAITKAHHNTASADVLDLDRDQHVLHALFVRVLAGDSEALQVLARRWIALERTVEELEQRLAQPEIPD